MNFKRMLAMLLALCAAFALCACSGNNDPTDAPTQAPTEAPTQAPTEAPDDGKITYTVTVTDEGGNPISGAMVQICKDVCIPGMTDASGVVSFTVDEADYKVSFLSVPAGYELSGEETEFHFADGSTEMTITLKAVQ